MTAEEEEAKADPEDSSHQKEVQAEEAKVEASKAGGKLKHQGEAIAIASQENESMEPHDDTEAQNEAEKARKKKWDKQSAIPEYMRFRTSNSRAGYDRTFYTGTRKSDEKG